MEKTFTGSKAKKLISFLDKSGDECALWWPDKEDLWIQHDRQGWYRLNVFYNSDTA